MHFLARHSHLYGKRTPLYQRSIVRKPYSGLTVPRIRLSLFRFLICCCENEIGTRTHERRNQIQCQVPWIPMCAFINVVRFLFAQLKHQSKFGSPLSNFGISGNGGIDVHA